MSKMSIVGREAVSAGRREITIALPFAPYRVRLFNRLLDQLGEPSRFLLTVLSQGDVTVADVLAATGLEPDQIERLLLRLQQLGLFQANDRPSNAGRQLGLALAQGVHGAEATLWIDRLNMRSPAVLLSAEPLLATEELAVGMARIAPQNKGVRSEVFEQQQRLFQSLKYWHRQHPLQPLIETLWDHPSVLLQDGYGANDAWELEFPLDQKPGESLWLLVRLPMDATNGVTGLLPLDGSKRPRLRLPALEWQIAFRTPEGLGVDHPLPAVEHRAHCLVCDHAVAVADLEEGDLAPEDVDWPLLPVLERIQGPVTPAPAYLERCVVIRRRSRALTLNHQAVLEQIGLQQAQCLYQPTTSGMAATCK